MARCCLGSLVSAMGVGRSSRGSGRDPSFVRCASLPDMTDSLASAPRSVVSLTAPSSGATGCSRNPVGRVTLRASARCMTSSTMADMPEPAEEATRQQSRKRKKRERPRAPSSGRADTHKSPPEKVRVIDRVSLSVAIVGVLVAGVAAIFAGLAYFGQTDATHAANTAALEQDASKVSYTLQLSSAGKPRELVITNRSIGAISNLHMNFPQPVQGCSTPCNFVGGVFFGLMNIPACDVLSTSLLNVFSQPSIGAKSLAGSDLLFTDQNGHTWALFGGEHNRLVEITDYKAPTGIVTLPAKGFSQASGCS